MLLMIDRVIDYWPTGGEAGLGRVRAEKIVDASEWFFKAHFYEDPVQPGSLGLEAMVQALQWLTIHRGLDRGMKSPRFEALATGMRVAWKYRGQVVPKNERVIVDVEIREIARDERGILVRASAALWVDGRRIYTADSLTLRVVEDG